MSEGKKPGFLDRLLGRVFEPLSPPVLPPEQEIALEDALHKAGETVADLPEVTEAEALLPPDLEAEFETAEAFLPEPTPVVEPAPPPPLPPAITPVPEPVFVPPPAVPAGPVEPAPRQSWMQRLRTGLKRSSDQLTTGITAVFTKRRLDEAMLEDLEDILIGADLGIDTASAVTDALRRNRFDRDIAADEVRTVLAAEVEEVLAPVARPLDISTAHRPFVILMVGVNGSGKTTTIGKLASLLRQQGKSVMLAAGDTFRAAAIEQLQVWGQRTGAPVVARAPGSDASGLAFDALSEARKDGRDVLIIDTAGRLQNRDELMSELEKIIRVIRKVDPTAPHATLLTLDATTGQNALNQVDIFGKRAGVTGLVMTKLDGTARGGILVAIARKYKLPVHFIGVGEGVDNLEPFSAREFSRALVGDV